MIDVSGLTVEAQPIAGRAAEVYLRHTRDHFVGLIAHGSAVKGGIIPGCSDIDLQLYLDEAAFEPGGHLPVGLSLAIHRDLARIDPAPFRYIQCVAMPCRLPPGWTGPVPGAYRVVAGRLPVPDATAEQLADSAASALGALDPAPSFIADGLLDHGGGRLQYRVRWLCTIVWPVLYQLLVVGGAEPIATWNLTKQEALERLPASSPAAAPIRRFYHAVSAYYPAEESVADALEAIAGGLEFLDAAKRQAAQLKEAR